VDHMVSHGVITPLFLFVSGFSVERREQCRLRYPICDTFRISNRD
jgi:hypothetical protein